jgi:FMN-dependent NADH-azoreductase
LEVSLAAGVEGQLKGKKAVLVLGRGGMYADGPMKAMDYQETYLRAVLGFVGITDIEVVIIEGVAMGPENEQKRWRTPGRRLP